MAGSRWGQDGSRREWHKRQGVAKEARGLKKKMDAAAEAQAMARDGERVAKKGQRGPSGGGTCPPYSRVVGLE